MLKTLSFNRGLLMALAIAIGALFTVLPLQKAHADAYTQCNSFQATTSGLASGYRYTPQYVVPSDADCTSIWALTFTGNCQYLRVRFYPSSGGNYANAWKYSCGDTVPVAIATTVLDGTRYRIESQSTAAASTFWVLH